MSPASITAFSTIVFGLTITPMISSSPVPAPEQNKPHQQMKQVISFDDEAASRGSRREREMYESTHSPSSLEVDDESSPYSRRVDRDVIDRIDMPAFDCATENASSSNQAMKQSHKRAQRSGSPKTSSNATTTTARQTSTTGSPAEAWKASPFYEANMEVANSMRQGNSVSHSPKVTSSNAGTQAAHHTSSTTTNRSVKVSYDQSTAKSAGSASSKKTSANGATQPGRRPVDDRAEKIPAPGSNLGNAKADHAASKKNTTSKQTAPSASAGKTDKE